MDSSSQTIPKYANKISQLLDKILDNPLSSLINVNEVESELVSKALFCKWAINEPTW